MNVDVRESNWSKAVLSAVERYVGSTGSTVFTRQEFIDAELDTIVEQTGSTGATPAQTLSRELQYLRNAGAIEFIDAGTYRWVGPPLAMPAAGPGKGVFVVGSHSIYADEPENFYRFPHRWMAAASNVVGNWIVYQEPKRAGRRGYYAVAKVERIVPDPQDAAMYLALIEPGTFLEFGRDVAFQQDGKAVERGLLYPDERMNNGRAIQSIRPISNEDFDRIVELGLIEEDAPLPRDVEEESAALPMVAEEPLPWGGPVDRATMLVNRTMRDRQFRRRVLDVYDRRCALTGMQIINGGGRAETQAAHIMSVEAGGPDVVTNGIALSGTVHWMFDRGLIALSDAGEILLSKAINDVEGVQRLIYPDRQARLPNGAGQRPHPRYLAWHREVCFYG